MASGGSSSRAPPQLALRVDGADVESGGGGGKVGDRTTGGGTCTRVGAWHGGCWGGMCGGATTTSALESDMPVAASRRGVARTVWTAVLRFAR